MIRNAFKIIAFFIVGMVGGIFAEQIFWPYFVERPFFYEYRLEKNPVYVTERKEIIIQENTALTQAIEKVEKNVVGVRTVATEEGKILEGSGLIVTADGLIVALADLVPQGSRFSFFTEGKKVAFQILKRDLKENLALIKLEKTNLPMASFADLEKIKLGERVFLVGTIFETTTSTSVKASPVVDAGIIQSFDADFINTNIKGESTFSGSPLFNIKGEVLGINTIDSGGKIITIPVSKIKTFIGM